MENKPRIIPKGNLFPFIVLASCFAWWGLANNMTDPLVKAFTGIYKDMSNFEASLIQFAFYGAYFCLAIPGALINRKFSYKHGVLVGLGVYIVGCFLFYPASQSQNFYFFLIAFYVLAGGLTILETAADPYILSMGSEETATQRLNLAQSFNPMGSLVGTFMCQYLILAKLEAYRAGVDGLPLEEVQSNELSIVVLPYIGVGVFLLAIWVFIAFMKMPHSAPQAATPDHELHFMCSVRRLMKNRNYIFSIVAQFFYVGVQISAWTFTVYYIPDQLGIKDSEALKYHTIALISFAVMRFVCTALMSYIKPGLLLLVFSLAAIACSLLVIFVGGMVGVCALVGISACMSLMFPTIFGLGTVGLGQDTKIGGSGLIMAILGGALIPLVQAMLIDHYNVSISYSVPLVCFGVIASYAAYAWRKAIHTKVKYY